MGISQLIGGSSTLLFMTTASAIFAPVALAGPKLYFYYGYLNISTADCMSRGYQILGDLSLQIPSRIERQGDAVFAIGESQSITAIIDCSEVANSGRVSVMASSSNLAFTLNYPRKILIALESLSR